MYMKKFAGITWWKGNYGSILQAYALGKTIDKMGIVDFEFLQQFKKNALTISSLFSYINHNGLSSAIQHVKYKYGNRKLRERVRKCNNFIDEYIKISNKVYNTDDAMSIEADYDGFVCGSDQIWNPAFSNCTSIYWLNFSNSKEKVAYAPSIGITTASPETKNDIRNALNSFKAISCRESTGSSFLNSVLGENRCVTVLDPTLLLDRNEWDMLLHDNSIKEKYVFSYVLRGTDQQRLLIKRFAERNNLKLVTIPLLEAEYHSKIDCKYADYNIIDASPIDFIALIKGAEYVFTDSFHCMIFSCIYHRPFFSLYKTGKNQMLRIEDFQEWLCIGNRVVENYEDIENMQKMDMSNAWELFDFRIKEERKKSVSYLYEALKN